MKKTNKVLFSIIMVSLLSGIIACNKLTSVPSISAFNVVADKQSYNIGDTVNFTIYDDADIITFYDGKLGMNINNSNRYIAAGTNILKFQTALTQANVNNMGDTILLKIGTNLKSYDSSGVYNANWTDITNLANWPVVTTSGFVSSGKVDVSSFNNADSVYIAFQVLGKQKTTTSQRKWQIQAFTLCNILADSSYTPLFFPKLNTFYNPSVDTTPSFLNVGWTEVNIKNNPPLSYITTNYGAWNVGDYGFNASNTPYFTLVNNVPKPTNSSGVILATNYPVTFDPSNVKNTPANEDWLISSAVNLKTVRPDFPTAVIKNEANTPVKGFKYIRSGGILATYKVVIDATFISGKTYDMAFVAQNLNVNQSNEVVKHIQVKVN